MKRFIAILFFLSCFSFTLFTPFKSEARVSFNVNLGTPAVVYPYPQDVYVMQPPVYVQPRAYSLYPIYSPPYREVIVFKKHHKHKYSRFYPAPIYYRY